MNRENDFLKRIESEQRAAGPIRNKDLVCKDCLFRMDDTVKWGNTTTCEIYEHKPNKVLLGGKCENYFKDN